jgi:hypothetical protein
VPPLWVHIGSLAQPSLANPPSINERHGALFLVLNLPSLRRVMRGAFVGASPTKSGTHDALGSRLRQWDRSHCYVAFSHVQFELVSFD